MISTMLRTPEEEASMEVIRVALLDSISNQAFSALHAVVVNFGEKMTRKKFRVKLGKAMMVNTIRDCDFKLDPCFPSEINLADLFYTFKFIMPDEAYRIMNILENERYKIADFAEAIGLTKTLETCGRYLAQLKPQPGKVTLQENQRVLRITRPKHPDVREAHCKVAIPEFGSVTNFKGKMKKDRVSLFRYLMRLNFYADRHRHMTRPRGFYERVISFDVDLFATWYNSRAPNFASPFPDVELVKSIGSFSRFTPHERGGVFIANPPDSEYAMELVVPTILRWHRESLLPRLRDREVTFWFGFVGWMDQPLAGDLIEMGFEFTDPKAAYVAREASVAFFMKSEESYDPKDRITVKGRPGLVFILTNRPELYPYEKFGDVALGKTHAR